MAPLTINVLSDIADGICRIQLQGVLEYGCVPSVSECVENLLNQGEKKLLIDMTGVTRTDSKGLGAILSVRRMCNEHQSKFVLWNIQENALKVFERTQLDKKIPICKGSLDDAKRLLSD